MCSSAHFLTGLTKTQQSDSQVSEVRTRNARKGGDRCNRMHGGRLVVFQSEWWLFGALMENEEFCLSSLEGKRCGEGMLLLWSRVQRIAPLPTLLGTWVGELSLVNPQSYLLDSISLILCKVIWRVYVHTLHLDWSCLLQFLRPRFCLQLRLVWNCLQISGLCFWLDYLRGGMPLTQQRNSQLLLVEVFLKPHWF